MIQWLPGFFFSVAMGANYSFYVKTIETHARAFFKVIIFSIGTVRSQPQNLTLVQELLYIIEHEIIIFPH